MTQLVFIPLHNLTYYLLSQQLLSNLYKIHLYMQRILTYTKFSFRNILSHFLCPLAVYEKEKGQNPKAWMRSKSFKSLSWFFVGWSNGLHNFYTHSYRFTSTKLGEVSHSRTLSIFHVFDFLYKMFIVAKFSLFLCYSRYSFFKSIVAS